VREHSDHRQGFVSCCLVSARSLDAQAFIFSPLELGCRVLSFRFDFLVSSCLCVLSFPPAPCSTLRRQSLHFAVKAYVFLLIIWFSPFTCDSAWTLLVSEVQSQSFPEPRPRVLTLSAACSFFFIRSPPRCSLLHAYGFAHP
jgi:hypothetical protein